VAVGRLRHSQDLAPASDKQSGIGNIYSQSVGSFAASNRPLLFVGQRLWIEIDDRGRFFEVYESCRLSTKGITGAVAISLDSS
jgi:hypothetical protein